MSKKVLVVLATGFEEVEALTPVDILRRSGSQVTLAGVGGLKIKGAHSIEVSCDAEIANLPSEGWDLVVCPGGMPGSANLAACWEVNKVLATTAASGGIISAICAAPAVVLGPAGLLEGHKAVCYPGMEKAFPSFSFGEERVCVDSNVITGRGPGCAMDFSLELVRALYGDETVKNLSEALVWKER